MSNLSVKDLFRTEYRNLRSACWKLGELEQKALSVRRDLIKVAEFIIATIVWLLIAPIVIPILFTFVGGFLMLVIALICSIADPSLIGFWDKGVFTFGKFFAELRDGWEGFNILENANRSYFILTHPSAWRTESSGFGIACIVILYVIILACFSTVVTYLFQLAFYAFRYNRCLARARSSYETVENLRSKHQLRLKETIEDNLHEMHDYIYS